MAIYSVITGTGNYIPTNIIKNEDFLSREFYEKDGVKLQKENKDVILKFQEITTIVERRYVTKDQVTSDIASEAAESAIESSGIDKEELDYVIVAHNFGDVSDENKQLDIVPSLAALVGCKQ